MDLFRNKKTGQLYVKLREAVNATNAQDGQKMILYAQVWKSGDVEAKPLYVREAGEFNEKFERVVE